jgi:hypothetical protein
MSIPLLFANCAYHGRGHTHRHVRSVKVGSQMHDARTCSQAINLSPQLEPCRAPSGEWEAGSRCLSWAHVDAHFRPLALVRNSAPFRTGRHLESCQEYRCACTVVVPSSTATVLSHIDQLFLGGYLLSLALCSRWAHPCFFKTKVWSFWGNIPKFWNLSLFWGEDVCSFQFFQFFYEMLSCAESCLLKEISSVVVCFEKMGHCVVAPQNECSCLELVLV